MHMVTRLSRKVVVVMVFRNDWAAEGRQTELKGAKALSRQQWTRSAFLHSAWGLQSISRSVVDRQSLFPSLAARSFCFRLLPTLRRRPTVVTWW